MVVINKARTILTDDEERQKYDDALDRLKSNDGQNPGGLVEIGAPIEQKAEPTTAGQIVTIACAYKDDNFEIAPKNFAELELFIQEDSDLEPKTYQISYMRKGKEFKMKN